MCDSVIKAKSKQIVADIFLIICLQKGDLSCWNITGNIQVYNGGGYGTEKGFVTSHMWCSRYQEVNLLESFSAEYLDTAPDIQVYHKDLDTFMC